jgi:hypothetical protein
VLKKSLAQPHQATDLKHEGKEELYPCPEAEKYDIGEHMLDLANQTK